MSDLLRTLAAYIPASIIQTTLTDPAPKPPQAAQAERFPAAILFADVSGFTPLTEALAQKGAEGPEELTRLLNGYFSRMITLVEAEGGEVVKFSGDAVTVVFPAGAESLSHATRRAWQAAEAMQAAMAEFATMSTSAGPIALGMKIGIGAGEILAAKVGGIFNRWEYVIAGDPLRQVAEAEHQAQRGDIILSPEAEALLLPHSLPPQSLAQPDWSQVGQPEAIETMLRCYVPGAVLAWLEEGLHAWLAVLRPMSVLFIGVSGLDYSQAEAIERLNTFLQATQETIYRYEGSINKLAVDDKGTILIALFGAPPHAHEDDPERAVRCALDLQAVAEAQGLRLAIGITTGRVFAGPVGSETRREYTVMGDTVNLAARLMAAAGPGQSRCDDETYRLARHKLAFETLPPVRLKGKAGLIDLYRPTGQAGQADETGSSGVLIGRQAELARLAAVLAEVQQGDSRLVLIEGEAGIGKSRLVQELRRSLREGNLASLMGSGQSIEQQTPYRAWRDVFTTYFDLEKIEDSGERQRQVRSRVAEIIPEMAERLPLLNDVLNLGLPENELTGSLDSHLRHESLVSMLLALLRARAVQQPLGVILEDAHWLDSLSWDLALQVARALTAARVSFLMVVAMRPLSGEMIRIEPMMLAGMAETERLELAALSQEETVSLAAARLGLPAGGLPSEVADLVRKRAGGNPFFAEELMYALRDNHLITVDTSGMSPTCRVMGDLSRAAQTLPDTIQGIVLSRIDRLPPEAQLALKMAAVIGRTFGYTILSDTLGEHMELNERLLKIHLDDLVHLEFTPLDVPEPELTYIFKHIITQEVAYETLLFAQRRQLHRTVAQWYEMRFDPDGAVAPAIEAGQLPARASEASLAPFYPLLVYHWHQAEAWDRERLYAWLAGQWAAAQYANVEAAGYFSRALALTPETELVTRYELLLAREGVNDLRGEREAQAADLATLAGLAQELQEARHSARVWLRQANYAEVTSDYPAALVAAQQAVEQAALVPDPALEAEGNVAWGIALWRQGRYEAARDPLGRALVLARQEEMAALEARSLYYLGHSYLYQDNYPDSQAHYRQALKMYRRAGHRQGEADSLSILGVTYYGLGDYATAGRYYEQVRSIFHTTGDRRGETVVLNNLGNLYCDLGDFTAARTYHEQAWSLRHTIGDRWGEAQSLTNLALVYYNLGDYPAARLRCEQALASQREIGDRRNVGYSLTYLGHILAELDDLPAAEQAYEEAMTLRRELGQQSLAIDDLAGLAMATLAQGDLAQAQLYAEEALAWLQAHGPAGIEYPFQVYLACYRVLTAAAKEDPAAAGQAQAVLAEAHTALQKQAAGLTDETLRHNFLENIRTHREIMAAWAAVRPK